MSVLTTMQPQESSKTIQDCASISAAERRERRRQKILQNATNRISKILAGPDGDEQRQAPTIEGMCDGTEPNGDGPKKRRAQQNASGLFANITQEEIDYVQPVYREFIDRNRFSIMALLGVAFRLLVLLGWVDYVALTFTALFFAYQLLFELPHRQLKYPKHGYLVNFLLVCGLNERMVIWIGLALDILWEFTTDFCIMTFAFLMTHCVCLLTSLLLRSLMT